MDITPLIRADRQIIQGYGPGFFRVGGTVYNSPIIVFPDRVAAWDFRGEADALGIGDFQNLFESAGETEVVLFGSGAKMQFIKPAIRRAFIDRGLALESMDTGAACRTYNVLLAEERRIAAALLPV